VVFREIWTKFNGGWLYEKLTASTRNFTSASMFVCRKRNNKETSVQIAGFLGFRLSSDNHLNYM